LKWPNGREAAPQKVARGWQIVNPAPVTWEEFLRSFRSAKTIRSLLPTGCCTSSLPSRRAFRREMWISKHSLRLHYLARWASQGNYCPQAFRYFWVSHKPSERLLRKCGTVCHRSHN